MIRRIVISAPPTSAEDKIYLMLKNGFYNYYTATACDQTLTPEGVGEN